MATVADNRHRRSGPGAGGRGAPGRPPGIATEAAGLRSGRVGTAGILGSWVNFDPPRTYWFLRRQREDRFTPPPTEGPDGFRKRECIGAV